MRFEKRIRFLLKFIPPEHIIGLEQIILMDSPIGNSATKEHLNHALGSYQQKWEGKAAFIELYAKNIFGENPLWLIFFVPYVATKQMANVLFHEIGHHRRFAVHGVTKRLDESSAELYAERYHAKFLQWYHSFLPKLMRRLFTGLYICLSVRREPLKTHLKNMLKLKREKPDDPDVLLRWAGFLWLYFGEFKKAGKIFQRVINMGFKVGDVYYYWARMEWERASFPKTIELLGLALENGTSISGAEDMLQSAKRYVKFQSESKDPIPS